MTVAGAAGAALGFSIAWATGFLLLRVLTRREPGEPGVPGGLLLLGLAAVVGTGLHTLVYFAWVLLLRPWPALLFGMDGLLLLASGLLALVFRAPVRARAERMPLGFFACTGLTAMGVGLGMVLRAQLEWNARLPLGEWDAWAMWNAKGLMLFHAPPTLASLFTGRFPHPDYPLLLPLTLARLWRYAGSAAWAVPQAVATATTLLAVLIIAGGVAALRGVAVGCVAGLLLLCSLFLIDHGGSQYADLPLIAATLAALVSLAWWLERGHPTGVGGGWLVVLGLTAGAAAWTKNEGLVTAAAIGLVVGVVAARRGRRELGRAMGAYGGGLLPFALALLLLKAGLVEGGTDLFQRLDAPTLADRAVNPARHAQIFRALRAAWWEVGDIAAVLLMVAAIVLGAGRGIASRFRAASAVAAVVVIQAAGYLLVYLLLSERLLGHLQTSANRTLLHLWPGLVLAASLLLPRLDRGRSDAGAIKNPLDAAGTATGGSEPAR